MGLTKYLKAAFLNQWNLLLFGGAMGFVVLSGRMDIFAPLVFAGEIAYLGFLGTHSKFQRAVEAQEAKANRQDGTVAAQATVHRILGELPKNLVQQFNELRSRCEELRDLSSLNCCTRFFGNSTNSDHAVKSCVI